jgi:hypothetical protein
MVRCANDGDWVRQEISLAIEQQKHIVPVNPDNGFDGFPEGMPEALKDSISSHQHSEISFGQALGATIDLLIKNRIVPTLGERDVQGRKDEDYAAAQETLRRQDAHHRFMKRLGIAGVIALVAIVLDTCLLLMKRQQEKDDAEAQRIALNETREEVQERHRTFRLQLNTDLSMRQMATIDTLLLNMKEIYPDSIWMSKYELTIGQWYGIKDEPYDESKKDMPLTNVSFGEIYSFLMTLGDMTNLTIELPSIEVWEYAARGGDNKEKFLYVGDDDVERVAWYKDNSGGEAHPSNGRQGKEPNTIDLFDMSGNVSELCNSPYGNSGQYTVCGGDYDAPASEVTVTSRKGFGTNDKDKHVGFRIIIRKPSVL